MSLRVGIGFDIHRLEPGRPLFLGCVEIPHDKGLLGHSDGDAAAHALADALLGAAGLDDIGEHFPPGDPEWAGVAGLRILEETRRLLAAHGAAPVQADVTIVAEEPRLADFRSAMRDALARPLGLTAADLSVKARTHEGLGEIGRGEAIAVYAVALVELARRSTE